MNSSYPQSSPAGSLVPLEETHCPRMKNLIESVIYPSDWCVLIDLEFIDCPLYLTNNTMVTLSLDTVFDGFAATTQNQFYCDKVLILLDSWKTLRHKMMGGKFTKRFDPYTRIAFFAETDSNNYQGVFDEEHLRQINQGALYVYYGRILDDDEFELEDVLTGKVIKVVKTQLEKVMKESRNLLLHPLFNSTARVLHTIKVSLYHCDPFVIRLDEKGTTQRYIRPKRSFKDFKCIPNPLLCFSF